MSASLGEAEVLYGASDKIKAMAESGQLKAVHDNVVNLQEASETSYLKLKDQLMSIVNAGHGKEDDVFDTLIEDHEMTGIRKHHIFGESIFDMMSFTYKMASVENLSILEGAIDKAEDKSALEQCRDKLVPLLGSKVDALEQLVALQEAYVSNVDGDAANEKLLNDLKMDYDRCLGSFSRYENVNETEASEALKAQTAELVSQVSHASSTFGELAKAHQERNDIFSSFQGDLQNDRSEAFRLKLIQHLSMNIVIKESRSRYQ